MVAAACCAQAGVSSGMIPGPIANTLLVGGAAGSASVVLSWNGGWTASSNGSFLHVPAGSASGTGSAVVVFTYDAFPGSGTRTGTLTIAGVTVTVTQAGTNYLEPGPLVGVASSGLNSPFGVAVDGGGNLYLANYGSSAITEWNASTQQLTTLVSSGLSQPWAVAVDGAGNVYIADYGNSAIKEWNAATQQVTALVSAGLAHPQGVAVDGQGNVYFSDSGNNAIKQWNVSTQQVTTLVSNGLNTPQGVAVDGAGNVYFSDSGNSAIKEWNAATQQVTTLLSSGLNSPSGVAVDGSGNVYIADTYNSRIEEWSAATQQVTTLAVTGLYFPEGVAVDGAGDIYIADSNNNTIKAIPYVFTGPASLTEGTAAGSDALLPTLPATTPLTGIFAPTSDQSWLTIGSVANGLIGFTFTANTSYTRVAHITALGQRVTVTQNGLLGTPLPLTIMTSGTLLSGFTGGAYSQDLTASGGAIPYTWTVVSGLLPAGLALSGASIAGTPTTAGTFSFTLEVSDALGNTATQAFALTVVSVSGSAALARVGVLSQFSAGGSWDTSIWVVNTSGAAVPVRLIFHGDDGTTVLKDGNGNVTPTALTAAQQGDTQSGLTATTLDRVLNPNTSLVVGCGLGQSDNVEGWIDVLAAAAGVNGFAVFRYAPDGLTPTASGYFTPYEGTVPLQTQLTPSTMTLPFDNTSGFNNGVAIGTLSGAAATITATFYDINGGSTLGGAQQIALPADGHTAFLLYQKFPLTANQKGSVVFTGTTMMGLGLRASPYGTLTSVPTILQ
jgi:sugar lactone lactonase YvrE